MLHRNRLNPAEPDYQIRLLLRDNAELRDRLTRTEFDAGSFDDSSAAYMGYSVSLDPDNARIIVHHYNVSLPTNAVPVPVGTLMVPDPVNPHAMTFPTL